MKHWFSGVLALCCSAALAQEPACTTFSVHTDPALKAYRIDGSTCRRLHQPVVQVDGNAKNLVLYVISSCRDIGGPTFCKIPVEDIGKVDGDGNCTVEADWQVTSAGGSCQLRDR